MGDEFEVVVIFLMVLWSVCCIVYLSKDIVLNSFKMNGIVIIYDYTGTVNVRFE